MHKSPSFLASGIALLAVVFAAMGVLGADPVRIGIITDVHAHDTNSPNEGKVMVDYPDRLEAFIDAMVAWPADAVLELGDLVNGAFVMGADLGDPARIPAILDDVVARFARYPGPIYYVIGNHDVYDLTKAEFLVGTSQDSTYYSFDLDAYHIVVLDAQYAKNGEDYQNVGWMVQGFIPEAQLNWLKADLASTDRPTIVAVHQPLDVAFSLLAGGPPIFNAQEVRTILVDSGVVIAVVQGHTHESSHTILDGIHYITFAAMVDHDEPIPPTWAEITLSPDERTIDVTGRGLQETLQLTY